jgi:predicted amidophosphoribosyltransferase
MLEIPRASHALRRVRDTPSQTALDVAERHRNVRGAFAISGARARRQLLAAHHVAVVDDVVTTGSTLNEMRAVLLRAGVGRVDVWAVARA